MSLFNGKVTMAKSSHLRRRHPNHSVFPQEVVFFKASYGSIKSVVVLIVVVFSLSLYFGEFRL